MLYSNANANVMYLYSLYNIQLISNLVSTCPLPDMAFFSTPSAQKDENSPFRSRTLAYPAETLTRAAMIVLHTYRSIITPSSIALFISLSSVIQWLIIGHIHQYKPIGQAYIFRCLFFGIQYWILIWSSEYSKRIERPS